MYDVIGVAYPGACDIWVLLTGIRQSWHNIVHSSDALVASERHVQLNEGTETSPQLLAFH